MTELKKKFETFNLKLLETPLVSTVISKSLKLSPNTKSIDKKLNGLISKVIKNKEFCGKKSESLLLRTELTNVLLLGVGDIDEINLDILQDISAHASVTAKTLKCKTYVFNYDYSNVSENDIEAIVRGADLGLYDFNTYKSEKKSFRPVLMKITINNKLVPSVNKIIKRGEIISNAIMLSRDLSNLPSNDCTPTYLAQRVKKISSSRPIKTTVFTTQKLKQLGFGGLLGVAQGSKQPPCFIIMEYSGGKRKEKPIVFVGKTITFDTGGISIKPSASMDEMKHDKSGGATVIGIMQAVADLKLPVNVVGLIPATENMPGGSAYKPGDILTFYNKKTAEILNTDAEGRVILADALSYAQTYKPKMIIDFATLTGACIVALGTVASGMIGNDKKIMNLLMKSAEHTGEKVWELPLWDEYKKLIRSDVADIKNIGGRGAGTITAAAFLSHFVGEYPWVHLDIAGTAWTQEGTPKKSYIKKGATGVGVLLSIDFLKSF
jgi:leucyl aminopeptidase